MTLTPTTHTPIHPHPHSTLIPLFTSTGLPHQFGCSETGLQPFLWERHDEFDPYHPLTHTHTVNSFLCLHPPGYLINLDVQRQVCEHFLRKTLWIWPLPTTHPLTQNHTPTSRTGKSFLCLHPQGYLINWDVQRQVWDHFFEKDMMNLTPTTHTPTSTSTSHTVELNLFFVYMICACRATSSIGMSRDKSGTISLGKTWWIWHLKTLTSSWRSLASTSLPSKKLWMKYCLKNINSKLFTGLMVRIGCVQLLKFSSVSF